MSGADFDLWASLPVPAVRIDSEDRISDINPAAEGFLNSSARAMRGTPVWDAIAVDAPLEKAFQRARDNGTPLFVWARANAPRCNARCRSPRLSA